MKCEKICFYFVICLFVLYALFMVDGSFCVYKMPKFVQISKTFCFVLLVIILKYFNFKMYFFFRLNFSFLCFLFVFFFISFRLKYCIFILCFFFLLEALSLSDLISFVCHLLQLFLYKLIVLYFLIRFSVSRESE